MAPKDTSLSFSDEGASGPCPGGALAATIDDSPHLRALRPEACGTVPKRVRDGSQRFEDPETVLARIRPRLAEFGVTRLARLTGFDRAGVEVTMAVRPNARGVSVANGKGLCRASALASAAMEAIERWHAERPILPLVYGDAGDVAWLGLEVRTAGMPRRRATRTAEGPITWAPALDLVSGARALAPFELVHTNWTDTGEGSGAYFSTTNGLASGLHPVEAALHALCELVERDACALFERLPHEGRAARRIDLGSIDAPAVAGEVGRLTGLGFGLALWDCSTDIGAPVFLAALLDERAPSTPPGVGSGCHPDRGVAALRAITEAAQTRIIAITGAREDLGPELFAGQVGVRFRHALGEAQGGGRAWSAAPAGGADCLRADLAALVAAVGTVGCGPVLAVDLSREPGISVLRLLAPGLESDGAPGETAPGPRVARAAEIFA